MLYFEPKRRYHDKGEVDESVDLSAALSMEKARVVTEGKDVTLVAYGPLVKTARDAALAAADEGVSVEVIDLRSLAPLDFATLEASVRKTGRLVITHEASQSGGLGAEVAASITERCFYHLEAAPVRVTGFDVPYPYSKLEMHHLPGPGPDPRRRRPCPGPPQLPERAGRMSATMIKEFRLPGPRRGTH